MIRHVSRQDAMAVSDGIAAIMERAFPAEFGEAWTKQQFTSAMLMPGMDLFIAQDADTITGFALTRCVVDECELLLIAVDPCNRNMGIGQAFLTAIHNNCASGGISRIFLEMRENNEAISLYQRFGFVITGHRPRYYKGVSGQVYDALTLTKHVL